MNVDLKNQVTADSKRDVTFYLRLACVCSNRHLQLDVIQLIMQQMIIAYLGDGLN